jgi:hypothetical protein
MVSQNTPTHHAIWLLNRKKNNIRTNIKAKLEQNKETTVVITIETTIVSCKRVKDRWRP